MPGEVQMVENVKTEAESSGRKMSVLSAGLLACGVLGLVPPALAQTATQSTTWTSPSSRAAASPQATTPTGTTVDPTTTATTTGMDGTTDIIDTDPALLPEDPDAETQPLDLDRQNLRETTLDDPTALRTRRDTDSEGVRLGTMVLRPSISEKLVHERTSSGGGKENRTFSETGLKGGLRPTGPATS